MSKSTTPRKPVSKRIRFEVFKRDGFTCQYCGRRPPDVILHCDHIHPVADGGTNEMMNLVTSCNECNLGKGRRLLDDVKPTPDAELARLRNIQEVEELRAYAESNAELEDAKRVVVEALADLWCDVWSTSYSPDGSIAVWLNNYGPEEVDYAIRCGERKRHEITGSYERRCYIGAVLRNRRNARRGQTCATCGNSRDGSDGKLICLERPDPDKDAYFFCVNPQSSCSGWTD